MVRFKTEVLIIDVNLLSEEINFSKYFKQVSLERQTKIERLKSLNARALSLGAGLLLKEVFKRYDIGPEPSVIRNKDGKAFLKEDRDFHFNLSHSGHYAVCAASSQAVGIDIQKMKEPNLKLAKRFFHDREFEFLANLPAVTKKSGFNHLWTAKESYLKYLGTGLSVRLNSFEIQINHEDGQIQGEKVFLKNYRGPEDYAIWCCSENNHFDQKLKKITLEEEQDWIKK